VPDHAVSSAPGRAATTFELGGRLHGSLKKQSQASGIRFFDLGQKGQGIVHVMGPEHGLVLPGVTLICGDSHTCTNGGLGALAFGVGNSESAHALATQTLRQQKPRLMRVRFEGEPGIGVTPKDLILHLIGKIGAGAASGYAVEYAGSAIRAMPIEGRLTICNLSVELGAKYGSSRRMKRPSSI
jgi:3-isopropylmalate/(R)-2-methylmalate dehydratase large subunit